MIPPTTLPPPAMPSVPAMRRAFAAKDPAFDGLFVVAVRTTGIFCRPTCRAKPPRPQNVEFYPTPDAAARQGYRACKLCRPTDAAGATPPLVDRLVRLVDDRAPDRVTSDDLSAEGIDPSTARRQFARHMGVTFAAYQRARRLAAAADLVRTGGAGAIEAQVEAGFESGSGFRAAVRRAFGTAAADLASAVVLASARLPTPIGPMLAVAGDAGVAVCDFEDRAGTTEAIERARARRGHPGRPAAVVPGDHPLLARLAAELAEYFAGRRQSFGVPLAVGGTPFQQRAWAYLRQIPFGQTRAYGQQAAAINSPLAIRAVGRANGSNFCSILIPCHRVVAADGALTGYGGGMARKRWLLDHERRVAGSLVPLPGHSGSELAE